MDLLALKPLEYYKIREKLISYTRTVFGKEYAEILLPTADRNIVEERLEETDEAVCVLTNVAGGGVPLGNIADVRAVLKRAELGAVLFSEDFVAILTLLTAARRVRECFAAIKAELFIMPEIVERVLALPKLETRVERTFDDQGEVRDSASAVLAKIRRDIRVAKGRVKEKLEGYLHSEQYKKYLQESLVTMRGDRYVLPVKQECRGQVPGIIHDQSASGSTIFIEPAAVVNLNNDIKRLQLEEKTEIEKILAELSAAVAVNAEGLLDNCDLLGKLDFILAKGALALAQKAEQPEISENKEVILRQARHPLIESNIVVPIDMNLGKELNTLLITGPNTGGKTVALKTLGLFSLMMQAGLFVPADKGTRLPIFANVFADIGDEQSIEQSLSTFSSHMTNLVKILQAVGSDDLVLADELGAGTDPDEGAALAVAILEKLYSVGALTVITTHYNDLKTYAYRREGMENASVEFDITTLKPTYRLLQGIPGSSNAFAISARLGLSADIIEKAEDVIGDEHIKFEKVLLDIDEERRKLEDGRREMQMLQRDVEALKEKLQKEEQGWKAKKRELWHKTRAEAQEWLRQEKRQMDDVIEELKKLSASEHEAERQRVINDVRSKLREKTGEIDELVLAEEAKNSNFERIEGELAVGQTVRLVRIGQTGTVLEISPSGEDVTVQVGAMKLHATAADLQLVKKKDSQSRKDRRDKYDVRRRAGGDDDDVSHGIASVSVAKQLDIRGKNVEEALPEIDKYLYDALMSGFDNVIIIHGKGTGLLRTGVREYLKTHGAVKSAKIAELNEGGNGATAITLK